MLAMLIHGNPKNKPRYLMVIFHDISVDVGYASIYYRSLIDTLPIHILLIEYPGYGLLDGNFNVSDSKYIADNLYDFITENSSKRGLGISPDKIIVVGRSIGTGLATYFAQYKCKICILINPFTTVHNIYNEISYQNRYRLFGSYLINKDLMYNNLDYISKLKCDHAFIIHGLKNKYIPPSHSKKILKYLNKYS